MICDFQFFFKFFLMKSFVEVHVIEVDKFLTAMFDFINSKFNL